MKHETFWNFLENFWNILETFYNLLKHLAKKFKSRTKPLILQLVNIIKVLLEYCITYNNDKVQSDNK